MLTKSDNLSLLGFVPALVVQYISSQGQVNQLPEKQFLKSVVMFADISGFTNLTETLSKLGNEGSELIAFAINRYMELLVSAISKSGGDIFKFAGDAMIVVWPPSTKENVLESHEELRVICRLAIQAALDIQSKLDNTTILEDIRLSVKIGFGIGDINIIYVGGVFNRSEYLATGDPLTQAFKSEHHATSGGQIIVSQQVYQIVQDFFVFQKLDNHYLVIKLINNKIQLKAGAQLIKNQFCCINKQQIMGFVPAALLPYIDIEQEKWSSELRCITTLFINLGIDLSDADSRLQHIQKVIETVQKCVYLNEGSLNKLLMDDKGSTLIVGFGLPPLKHQDDPIRAVQAAQLLVKQLSLINCKCYIGIATGVVFTGVVGTSGSRREYSILGDAVNLAARLMQQAITENKSILICQKTAQDCQHKFESQLFKMVQLKGKSGLIPIYQLIEQTQIMKTHFYGKLTHQGVVGFKEKTEQIMYVVNTFLQMDREGKISLQDMDVERDFVLIKGNYGVGKTFIMKTLAKQIKIDNPNVCILESSINSFEKIFRGNGFRSIIKQMFQMALNKTNKTSQELLEQISKGNSNCQKVLEELLDLSDWMNEFVNQFPKPQPNLDEKIIKLIGYAVVMLFEIYFEFQIPDKKLQKYLPIEDESDQSADIEKHEDVPPIIIILDDLQYYDSLSFYLIKQIIKKFNRILLIGVSRDNFWEIPIMSRKGTTRNPNRQQELVFERGVESILNLYNVTPNEVIIKGIRNIQEQRQMLLLYFGFERFSDPRIHELLHMKSCGQPLILIHLVGILLDKKYLIRENDQVYATNNLQQLMSHEEWLQVEIPQVCQQVNAPIIDSLSCIHLLLLKFASVIGDIFDIQTLYKIIPFKQINQNKLLLALKQLVQSDIIEFMHDDDENRYYRFVAPFMRESLYQAMIYSQRRSIHSLVAEALQSIPQPYEDSKELKRLEYHWSIAEQRVSIKNQNNIVRFSHRAKKSLIVKQIQMILKTDHSIKTVLKKGFIYKRSDKKVSWQYRYCIINSENMILYLNDCMMEQTGILPLKLITTITPMLDTSEETQQYRLQVGVTNWIKKGKEKGEKRIFLFAFESEDSLEEWTIFLEFVKAKSIYNDFVENFGKIQLPINLINEAYDPQLTLYLQEMCKGSIKRFKQNNVTQEISQKNRKSTHNKQVSTYQSPNNNPKRYSVRFSAISEQEEKSDDTPLKEKLRQFFFLSFQVLSIHLLNHAYEPTYVILGQEGRSMRRLKKHHQNRIPSSIIDLLNPKF